MLSKWRKQKDVVVHIHVLRVPCPCMPEEVDRDELAERFWREENERMAALQKQIDEPILPQPEELDDSEFPSLPEDDGAEPQAEEVAAVMNAGMCDSVDLVGTRVLYETDGRGGKRYALPAIVTCVQRSHVDLPYLRAAEESGEIAGRAHQHAHEIDERTATVVVETKDGHIIPGNPLPIPLDGTVHLNVFTPNNARPMYVELSVPYDPTGNTPRSWRHHPDTVPF